MILRAKGGISAHTHFSYVVLVDIHIVVQSIV